ncbi:MAG: LysR family transcriptional regulator [Phenylobacterium sp.]|nr:LysR family transcriptional regulator [Phenylobacterium sp.]
MWDDLKVFLAVAREGTTLGAARRLGINQTTCARRIAALEATLGARLFERHAAGYRLLPLGARILPAVEAMEREAQTVEQMVAGDARETAKVVRLTTADGMVEAFISPAMPAFHLRHPNVHVELLIDNRHFDLTRGEADFAVRSGPPPTDPLLVARKVGQVGWAVYASQDYVAAHGAPTCLAEMADHPIVGFTYGLLFLEGVVPASAVRYKANSAHGIAQTLAGGLGVGGLPCLLGDREPRLVRCFDLNVTTWMWLIYPERLRDEPHIRSLSDCLAAHIATLRPMLAGIRG